jgi:glycosyltransferase involved in cell wall biosynthesis
MRILIATDAWRPQVNGVVQTLEATAKAAEALGAKVTFVTPEGFPSVPLPSYPGLRVALPGRREIARRIAAARPDAIHIATEGPIGHRVRRDCLAHGRAFTTSLHTRFADYVAARWPVPRRLTWRWLRWFHNAGCGTMVSTSSLADELRLHGFRNVARWPRGVDSRLFHPDRKIDLGLKRPVFLAVGRLAVEKSVDAFLALDLPGTKLVVGDGPARAELARRFPEGVFVGTRRGSELAAIYAGADVFVFPSRTDTFGLVLLEALASGLPVAGFPVAATRDVIGAAPVAALDNDLRAACLAALVIPRATCRRHGETLTWEASARCFIDNLARIGANAPAGALGAAAAVPPPWRERMWRLVSPASD